MAQYGGHMARRDRRILFSGELLPSTCAYLPANLHVTSLHDAFQDPATYWNGFMPSSGWSNVALDTHYYSIFTADQLRWTNQQRIDGICAFAKSMTGGSLWTYSGEWTPAITDCAGSQTVLGTRGSSIYEGTAPGSTPIGSCANMTGNGANFSDDMKRFMRQYWEVSKST